MSRQRVGGSAHRWPPVRPFALGKGEQAEAKAPSLAQRGLSDGVLSSARSFVREGEERAGVSGLTNAWEGLLIGGRLCDFLPWKRGSRWRRKRPLWRREGYLTVFSRLHDCSGEGKGGEGCTFWPQGTAYSPMLFSRCGPLVSRGGRQSAGCFPLVGGKRQEQFSPCLAPPALLEAILPAIQRVSWWGEIPLSRGLPCASRCPPAPSFWGGVFAAAALCPLRPERCGRGKAPAVCGAVCGLLPPALGGGPHPFGAVLRRFSKRVHRQIRGAISFRGRDLEDEKEG